MEALCPNGNDNSLLVNKEKTECCWVCLEEFIIGENIIELKWNPAHIFHPDWLEGWADRNTHWPLCRKDLIQMVQENNEDSFARQNENESRENLVVA